MRGWGAVLLASAIAGLLGCGGPGEDTRDAGVDASAAPPDASAADASELDASHELDASSVLDASHPLDGAPPVDASERVDAASSCAPDASSSSVGTAVFAGSTSGADDTPRTSECPQNGPDVLLAWTAPRSGYYRIDTISSAFDTVLSIRRACEGPEVACNDDGIGIRSSVTLAATEGETLLITLDGATPTSLGAYSVDITEVSGPQCDAPGYSCHGSYFGWRMGYVEDAAAPCAAPFAEEPFQLYDAADLVPGAHACECRCGAPGGGGCLSQLDCDAGAACVAGGARSLSGASCISMSFGWDIVYSCEATSPVPAGAGSCDSSVAEPVHEAPTWSPSARFCASPPAPTACEPFSSTVCEPRVPAGRTECIAQRGARSCPTPYATRTLVQGGLMTDTRRCDTGTCGCGPAAVTACDCPASGGCRASFYTSDFCGSGSLVASVPVGACSSFRWLSSLHAGRASLTAAEPVLDDCAVTGAPEISGDVRPVPENVITVCCKDVD